MMEPISEQEFAEALETAMSERLVLCQDCLAVAEYTDARHNEEEFCQCGGQFCGCEACHAAAAELVEAGNPPCSNTGVSQ